MDDLSLKLNDCKTDLVILSPCSAGLQQLLRMSSSYRVQFDIKFNSKKSVVMIVKTKEDLKQNFPSFYLGDQVLNVVNKIKYLGQIIKDDLNDDDDVQRQCCKLYGQANMLVRKFLMCTDEVKIDLFRAYCTSLYTAHLWCNYSKAKMKKLQVAFNDALRILLKLPRWTSASPMFAYNNIPTLHAVLRIYVYNSGFFLGQKRSSVVADGHPHTQ